MTSRQQSLLLVSAAAAAAVAWLMLSGTGAVKVAVTAQAAADPAMEPTGCPAHEITGGTLGLRHGLFRRFDGHAARACLSGGGWAWYLDPPASQGL